MQVIQLLSFSANNGEFHFTDAGANYPYENQNYYAGIWPGLDSFEQRSTPAINEHSIKLSDPDLSLTITMYAGNWQWQSLTVRWLIIDDNNNIIDNFLVMQGAITMHDTNDEDKREITLRVQENHTLELVTGHRTNTASQHLIDSEDNGFEMIPFLDGIKLPWVKAGNGVVNIPEQNDTGTVYIRKPRYTSPTQN